MGDNLQLPWAVVGLGGSMHLEVGWVRRCV